MCCMPWKPFNKCFKAATTKKHHFSRENGKKMPILGPNQGFLGLGGQLVPLLPYFEGAELKKKRVSCHCSHCTRVSGAPPPKKNIFRRKMAKKCQFLAQIRVFWVRLVSWSPPYPILRVLDSEKDVLRAIEAIEQVFQGCHHQKNTKVPKYVSVFLLQL